MPSHDLDQVKQLTMTVLMTPEMVNFSGKVHGGALLRLLDGVAYACAARYSGHYVVTLSADRVMFRAPVNVGELVTFLANINYVGTTSMEVGIKVIAENPREQSVRHVISCFFTMIAVDEAGNPIAVPALQLSDDTSKRRYEDAKTRKELRAEYEIRHNEHFQKRRAA